MLPPDAQGALRLRAGLAVSLAAAAGIFGFTATLGLTGSRPAAAGIALAIAALSGWAGFRRPPVVLDPQAAPRPLRIVSAVAAVAALLLLARLAVFIVDPVQAGYSTIPSSQWEVQHSCLTAYYVSGQSASTNPDIYDPSLSTLPSDDGTGVRKARMLGPFKIDVYEYPPPFLLLPRALMSMTPDFLQLRMVWFGLSGAVILAGLLAVAGLMGPAAGTRAVLMAPLVFAALPTLGTLQKGNVQVIIIAASLMAMVLFEKRRYAAGGALLGFAIASKLYPGLLVLYLLTRRQWRALAWTAAMGVGLVLLSVADTGWAPYTHFVHHLPGLLGGEAFPAFRNPMAKAINYSVPGLVFKLGLLGVPGMTFTVSKAVGWLFTIVAMALTWTAARRTLNEAEKPVVWTAIVILATLRSPFLPQGYATFPVIWIATLLAARSAVPARTLGSLLIGWAALNIVWPTDWPMSPALLALLTGVPQALTIILAVAALRPRMQDYTVTQPEAEAAPAS
jgi:alpha-1,2-mannosyltransferase